MCVGEAGACAGGHLHPTATDCGFCWCRSLGSYVNGLNAALDMYAEAEAKGNTQKMIALQVRCCWETLSCDGELARPSIYRSLRADSAPALLSLLSNSMAAGT